MDVFSIAIGAVGVAVAYFIYLAASKGLPAAVTWVKAKWNAGETELATLKRDVLGAGAKVDALAKGAVADVQKRLATVEADIATLKTKAATSAPAFIAAAAAPANPPA